ncbi:MAG: phosphonate C-P lyase system protein PhnG [Alphaproteobacteria bacterium]
MAVEVGQEVAARQRWMGILAKADPARLRELWAECAAPPDWRFLRRPETGMTMLRGRAGGTGARFNLGEMTVTRCSVRLDDGTGRVGHAYVPGSDMGHAEIAALADALLQLPRPSAEVTDRLIEPLAREQAAARTRAGRKAAATKVEFFTVVRGE